MNRTGIPYLDYTFNPFGFGCSRGCEGCWAKRIAPRIGHNIDCDFCAAFKPHVHHERILLPRWPSAKKPSSIGVQFTGELFDPAQDDADIFDVLAAAGDGTTGKLSNGSALVFLTQQPVRAASMFRRWLHATGRDDLPENWFVGVTVRAQRELSDVPKAFRRLPVRQWLSIEPVREHFGRFLLGKYLGDWEIAGVIVGCDNRPGDPAENRWIGEVLDVCQEADVSCYVKQVRDARGRCITDPALFPPSLRVRELAWRTEKP